MIRIFILILMAALSVHPATAAAGDDFLVLGEFSVRALDQGRTELTDGLGRVITLIPRGQTVPSDLAPDETVAVPVKRAVLYSGRDASLIQALGAAETIVG